MGVTMFEHILTALDGSQHDRKTLAAAKELARLSGGRVRILHVCGGHLIHRVGFGPDEDHDPASRLVNTAVADLVAAGLEATGTVRASPSGLVATEILEEAEESRASAIVMGSRGRGDLKGLLMGSTAHKVLQRGRLPVLVIR
jgi:nucleotide-binding universal stress UspA family protein